MKWLFLLLLFSTGCRAQNDSCSGSNGPYPNPPFCNNFPAEDSVQFCYTFTPAGNEVYFNPFILTSCSTVDLLILVYHNGCNTPDTGTVGYNTAIPGESYTVCFKYTCTLNDGSFQGICFFQSLPISLLYFDAKKVDDIVKLGWATGSEINNDYFAVERSTNGHGFYQLGIVDGAGNSTSDRQYSFTDYVPYDENYYRLAQHDYDGKISLSEIRYISMKTDDCIQVFDIYGQSLYIGSKKNFHPPAGIYIVFEGGRFLKYLKP